ncbi:BQ5605_C001g00772 [Microbotryum silenes-dioicae]|uniref:BQ5605_C001g00772 protein n=1 Tax=Microbotryum silenes-dioicae TaxID=796604 RepID=A0A2X0MRR3_9BASI|nr:BQ5605_C001g00772 [Microbotryum silenes-dioicae]
MSVSERLDSDQRFFDDLVEKSEAIISITNSSRSIGYRCAVCSRHKDRRLSLAQARAHFKTNVHKEQVQLQGIGVGDPTWVSFPNNEATSRNICDWASYLWTKYVEPTRRSAAASKFGTAKDSKDWKQPLARMQTTKDDAQSQMFLLVAKTTRHLSSCKESQLTASTAD